jgi:hypothetical protein
MNENMERSNESIQTNTQMVEKSTEAIVINTEEVKHSTEAMQGVKNGLPLILSAVAIFLLAPALILFVSFKRLTEKLELLIRKQNK